MGSGASNQPIPNECEINHDNNVKESIDFEDTCEYEKYQSNATYSIWNDYLEKNPPTVNTVWWIIDEPI